MLRKRIINFLTNKTGILTEILGLLFLITAFIVLYTNILNNYFFNFGICGLLIVSGYNLIIYSHNKYKSEMKAKFEKWERNWITMTKNEAEVILLKMKDELNLNDPSKRNPGITIKEEIEILSMSLLNNSEFQGLTDGVSASFERAARAYKIKFEGEDLFSLQNKINLKNKLKALK